MTQSFGRNNIVVFAEHSSKDAEAADCQLAAWRRLSFLIDANVLRLLIYPYECHAPRGLESLQKRQKLYLKLRNSSVKSAIRKLPGKGKELRYNQSLLSRKLRKDDLPDYHPPLRLRKFDSRPLVEPRLPSQHKKPAILCLRGSPAIILRITDGGVRL